MNFKSQKQASSCQKDPFRFRVAVYKRISYFCLKHKKTKPFILIMKYLRILCLSFSVFSCSALVKTDTEQTNIKGVWTLKYSSFDTGPKYASSEEPLPEPPFNTLLVTDSTISFFYYPLTFLYTCSYTRSSDKILLVHPKNILPDAREIRLEDSLMTFTNQTGQGDDWLRLTDKFVRDSVDPGILGLLKRDSINYKLLPGKWILQKSVSANDGSEPQELYFPIRLPGEISISAEERDTATNKSLIRLNIEGKNRLFKIGFLTAYSITIWPYGWQVENCPSIIYSQADE